jgi:peroxiredoxin
MTTKRVTKTAAKRAAKAPAKKAAKKSAKKSAKAVAKKTVAKKTVAKKPAKKAAKKTVKRAVKPGARLATKAPAKKTPVKKAPVKNTLSKPAPSPKPPAPVLNEGDGAPDFAFTLENGAPLTRAALAGAPFVLYFYPKDDTSGCTLEAQDFSAARADFDAIGVRVIGVSKDSPKKHAAFRAKHALTVELASDEAGAEIERFGAWVEKTLYGRRYMGIDRSTFLIDGAGVIRRAWRAVRVPGHVAEVLAAARALKG